MSSIVVAGTGVPVAKHGNRRRELALRVGRRARGARRADRTRRRGGRAVPRRRGRRVPVRARCSTRRWPTRGRCGASCGCRPSSTSSGRSPIRPGPFAQAVGCSDARMLPLMAEVLARRGTRAVLFRGDDGLDELTTTGPSTVFEVRDGAVPRRTSDPAESRLRPVDRSTTCAAATPAPRPTSSRASSRGSRARGATSSCSTPAPRSRSPARRRRSPTASRWRPRRSTPGPRRRRSIAGSRSSRSG